MCRIASAPRFVSLREESVGPWSLDSVRTAVGSVGEALGDIMLPSATYVRIAAFMYNNANPSFSWNLWHKAVFPRP